MEGKQMKSNLTSIPIEEVFEPMDGCPICRLYIELENHMVDYILGPAMMEPDVRIETNKQGFCFHHFELMMKKRNKLSVALMLESHLKLLDKQVFSGLLKDSQKQSKNAEHSHESCFVCNSIDQNMQQILQNLCVLWENNRDFRELYAKQPYLCLPHFSLLVNAANRKMSKKNKQEFCKITTELTQHRLKELQEDISHFCKRNYLL